MAEILIGPELTAGLPAFTAAIGPRTSVVWNAGIAYVTRNITFTGPGYQRVAVPAPEPSAFALAAVGALAIVRRRR
jgi:MYXO-CTERM domain-containing protein